MNERRKTPRPNDDPTPCECGDPDMWHTGMHRPMHERVRARLIADGCTQQEAANMLAAWAVIQGIRGEMGA